MSHSMIRRLLAAGAFGLLLLAAGCAERMEEDQPPFKVMVSGQVGQARNRVESELTDSTGKWSSPAGGPRVVMDVHTSIGIEASAEVSALWAREDTETWTRDGQELSTNDMTVATREARLLVGYGADIEEFGRLSLLGGMTYRQLKLERDLPNGDTNNWDCDLPFATIEGRASLPIKADYIENRLLFETSLSFGWLLQPEADVEGTTVKGDRGWLLRWRAGFDYELTKGVSLYLGGFVERMDLVGGVEGDAEWPDSRSTTGGAEIGLVFRF